MIARFVNPEIVRVLDNFVLTTCQNAKDNILTCITVTSNKASDLHLYDELTVNMAYGMIAHPVNPSSVRVLAYVACITTLICQKEILILI